MNVKITRLAALFFLIIFSSLSFSDQSGLESNFRWMKVEIPPIDTDEAFGISGAFSGVHNDALIIAGGNNFRNGQKVYYDKILVLTKTKTENAIKATPITSDTFQIDNFQWIMPDTTLDKPIAYGASVSSSLGLICIGGKSNNEYISNVTLLEWDNINKQIKTEALPPLPQACAPSAALLNDILYVSVSILNSSNQYENKFWALDLNKYNGSDFQWVEIPSYNGPARSAAVAGVQDGSFYIISGRIPNKDNPASKDDYDWLTDGYRFTPESTNRFKGTWTAIADLPVSISAAPKTALSMGQEHLAVFSGDDGTYFGQNLNDSHPGFSKDIYAYHTITDTWRKLGQMPWGIVSTNIVSWAGQFVIPAGENKPGMRSAEILIGQWNHTQKKFGAINWSVVIAYFIFLVLAGYYFSKRENGTEEFFLGGRNVAWWAAGLSAFGTGLSAITFMAIPAKSYATNFIYFYSQIIAWIMIPVFVMYYIPFFQRIRISTVYEYLEMRFNTTLRLIAGGFFVFFQVFRMGIVVFLPAMALSTITGLRTDYCIIIMGIICIVYTVMGGIEAVIWTDVVQVVILMGGALVSLLITMFTAKDGVAGFFHTALEGGKLQSFDWSWDYTVPTVWVITVGRVIGHLKEMSSQDCIQRILATKDEKSARKVIYVNGGCAILSAVIFMLLGTGLYVFFKGHPQFLDPMMNHDNVLPVFIVTSLPVGISGLIIAGVFAAAMSSLDSGMNSGSQVMINDFYLRIKPNASQSHYLFVGRILTVILGVVGTSTALVMAISGDKILSLWDLMLGIIGLFTGPIAGLFAVGIFTKRAHGTGGLIGLILSVLLIFYIQNWTHINFFLYGAIGVVACYIITYMASCVIPSKQKNIDGLTVYSMPKKI